MIDAKPYLTERLVVTLVVPDDVDDAIAYDRRNAEHLKPWEPVRDPAVWFDREKRRAALAERRAAAAADRAYLFFARLRDGGPEIVASITLSNIVRGAFQACHLGYSVDAAQQGKGIAFEAISAVIAIAFDDLGLHRLMANYQPINERSGKLLRRLGFVAEGYARDYLNINGEWRDHILTALVAPPKAGPR